jgi:hypothetical protein
MEEFDFKPCTGVMDCIFTGGHIANVEHVGLEEDIPQAESKLERNTGIFDAESPFRGGSFGHSDLVLHDMIDTGIWCIIITLTLVLIYMCCMRFRRPWH